jgi:alpha-ketoglutarate-dependent taurine dioxygenase
VVTVASPQSTDSLVVSRQIAGKIGAEIQCLHITGDLNRTVVNAIRKLLFRFRVLFLPNQGYFDKVEQEAFGSLFGE